MRWASSLHICLTHGTRPSRPQSCHPMLQDIRAHVVGRGTEKEPGLYELTGFISISTSFALPAALIEMRPHFKCCAGGLGRSTPTSACTTQPTRYAHTSKGIEFGCHLHGWQPPFHRREYRSAADSGPWPLPAHPRSLSSLFSASILFFFVSTPPLKDALAGVLASPSSPVLLVTLAGLPCRGYVLVEYASIFLDSIHLHRRFRTHGIMPEGPATLATL
ncbi:hypothetical protein B0H13DRAFT_2342822 [Mycena leptocephala]|nr:hypothetical protein B0H13DRAFT_2342822 [Mycena leptocephala]